MSEQKTVTQMPTKGQQVRLAECRNLGQAFETNEFKRLVAEALPAALDPKTMLRAFIQAANRTPLIYKCDLRQSVGAFLTLAHLGLAPGTPLQLAHMIPFKRSVKNRQTNAWEEKYDLNVILGYPGYLELAIRSGFVTSVHSDVVLPGEHFRSEHGTNKILEHRPELDREAADLTPRAAYAYVRMKNGDDEFEVMPWFDVIKIRNRSQSYQTAIRAKENAEKDGKRIPATWTEAPWVRDEREMGKKTAFRRLAKWLPKCPELRAGVAMEDAQDKGRLDYGAVIDGTATPWDGIPERDDEQEQQQTQDPGSAFGVRQQQETIEHEQETVPKGSTRQDLTSKAPEGSVELEFEAVMIDPFGAELASYTDAAQFARHFVDLANAPGNSGFIEPLMEFNADSIEDAKKIPAAAAILEELDKSEQKVELIPVVHERGKPQWANWARAMKAGIGMYPADKLIGFIELQRPTLEHSPIAQRLLALRAIHSALARHHMEATLLPWLADLLKPAPVEDTAQRQREVDAAWVETIISDLNAIGEIGHFDSLAKSPAVQSRMARIRQENPELFEKADAAFLAKKSELGG